MTLWKQIIILVIIIVTIPASEGICNITCSNDGLYVKKNCSCLCQNQWSGPTCEICNITKCLNGGLVENKTCRCMCQNPWSGPTCEICDLTYCENGGTFLPDDCSCDCPGNWMGYKCHTCGYDCKNGGRLSNGSCECKCTKSWTGMDCDICSLRTDDCEPGGIIIHDECKCNCINNWHGYYCDSCNLLISCHNNGTFVPETCGCICKGHWSGPTCAHCNIKCVNGGTRIDDECRCLCDSGWVGDECQFAGGPQRQAGGSDQTMYLLLGAGAFVMFIGLGLGFLFYKRKIIEYIEQSYMNYKMSKYDMETTEVTNLGYESNIESLKYEPEYRYSASHLVTDAQKRGENEDYALMKNKQTGYLGYEYETDTGQPVYKTETGQPVYKTETGQPVYTNETEQPVYKTESKTKNYQYQKAESIKTEIGSKTYEEKNIIKEKSDSKYNENYESIAGTTKQDNSEYEHNSKDA